MSGTLRTLFNAFLKLRQKSLCTAKSQSVIFIYSSMVWVKKDYVAIKDGTYVISLLKLRP